MNDNGKSYRAHKKPVEGDVFYTRTGCKVRVVEYINSSRVIIEHLNFVVYQAEVRSAHLRNGNVKNLYEPTVYGVGFFGEGDFVATVGGKYTSEYEAWSGMIRRCYHEKTIKKRPNYRDVTVSIDWHNFQNFAEWYTNQHEYGQGYHLDKDILNPNSKIYSPENCRLVPPHINALLMDSKSGVGVKFHKRDKVFEVFTTVEGNRGYLGRFSDKDEAHKTYKVAKESEVKRVAATYKDKVCDEIFMALMNWRVVV